MTATARRVLDECRGLLVELRSDPSGGDWRRLWILTVALLRTVGYALANVDAEADEELGVIINQHWVALRNTRPEPEIFWSFINEERNNILKEYRVNAGINVTVRPGTNSYDRVTGEVTEIAPSRPTLTDYVINEGPFAGQDHREVVEEAIQWWDSYLSAIEDDYAAA
ncbi:MAG: hypothetical protein ACFHXK_00780 [bacterium]